MHMAVYVSNGLVSLQHSPAHCAGDNAHHHWHVNLLTFPTYSNITSATICTELAPGPFGPWDIVTCQTEYV